MAAMKSFRYHIREMRREDLEEVTALEAACFSLPWKYRDFEEVLTNPDRCYLVAEADSVTADTPDRILGGCMLTHIAGEGDISNVAVYERYRNNGIAASVLSALLRLGEERYGITAYTLEVRSRNIRRADFTRRTDLSPEECALVFIKSQKMMLSLCGEREGTTFL